MYAAFVLLYRCDTRRFAQIAVLDSSSEHEKEPSPKKAAQPVKRRVVDSNPEASQPTKDRTVRRSAEVEEPNPAPVKRVLARKDVNVVYSPPPKPSARGKSRSNAREVVLVQPYTRTPSPQPVSTFSTVSELIAATGTPDSAGGSTDVRTPVGSGPMENDPPVTVWRTPTSGSPVAPATVYHTPRGMDTLQAVDRSPVSPSPAYVNQQKKATRPPAITIPAPPKARSAPSLSSIRYAVVFLLIALGLATLLAYTRSPVITAWAKQYAPPLLKVVQAIKVCGVKTSPVVAVVRTVVF